VPNEVFENMMVNIPVPVALKFRPGNSASPVATPLVMFRVKFPKTPVYVIPPEELLKLRVCPRPSLIDNVGTP
jgi:hypothetical protein